MLSMSRTKKTKPGPESTLTDGVILKIKESILDGKTLRETAEAIGVAESTLYSWKHNNQGGLQDKINTYEAMRQLKEADAFSKKLMSMSTTNLDGSINKGLLAIQQKESEFLREKLLIARDKYNSGNVVNVNVALPQPIIDLSKVVSTVDSQKSLENKG